MTVGQRMAEKRKALGFTQQQMAQTLHVSYQAVSKWENDAALPDVSLLSPIANFLHTTVDELLGHQPPALTEYEQKYQADEYYWGLEPNRLCYEILRLRPPVRPLRVLEMGCGEGKDAVFLARNGYLVSAFDLADAALEKAQKMAQRHHVNVDFFKADLLAFQSEQTYDIIFSSGVLHYLPPLRRIPLIERLKGRTAPQGLHVLNVFVDKPFIGPPPDAEPAETNHPGWKSGELFMLYYDWLLHRTEEKIFDCHSGDGPHQHCMDVLMAEKV